MKKYIKLILFEIIIGVVWHHHKRMLGRFLAAEDDTHSEQEYADRYSLWWKIEAHLKSLMALHIKKYFPND